MRWLAEKAARISARQSARPQPPVERGVVVVTTTPAEPVLASDEASPRRNHADHGHPTGYQAFYVFLLEECRGLLRNKVRRGGGGFIDLWAANCDKIIAGLLTFLSGAFYH
jgi:hypothetical protein